MFTFHPSPCAMARSSVKKLVLHADQRLREDAMLAWKADALTPRDMLISRRS